MNEFDRWWNSRHPTPRTGRIQARIAWEVAIACRSGEIYGLRKQLAEARAAAIEECAELIDRLGMLKGGQLIRALQPNPNWLAEHDREVAKSAQEAIGWGVEPEALSAGEGKEKV